VCGNDPVELNVDLDDAFVVLRRLTNDPSRLVQ